MTTPRKVLRVLITHEKSGVIRREFRKLGHDAYSCDLVTSDDNSPHHLQMDAFAAIRRKGAWDLVISHPVCRFLANSGALRLYIGGKKSNGLDFDRWRSMHDGAEDFRRLFFIGEYLGPLCVENPVMHGHAMDHILGPGAFEDVIWQTIQPNQFGDDASKRTVLWLRGLPKLRIDPTWAFPPRIVNGRKRWSNQTDSGQNKLAPSADRAAKRAQTYQGIAKQMAIQWSEYLLSK
jgi:hypothetical protein